MPTTTSILVFLVLVNNIFVFGCLITNCPRGGKRGKAPISIEAGIKPCVSCGPGRSGQCFGPNICCGPFGCLMGTIDTVKCQKEGLFHEREPCIAGNGFCRKNSGRCALDGLCCNQESCHFDKECSLEEKKILSESNILPPMDWYSLFANYPSELALDK